MSFWDKINRAVDDLFGDGTVPTSDDSFPSYVDSSDPYSSALNQANNVIPSQQPPPIANQTPLNPSDPFNIDPKKTIAVQSGNFSPFSVIDISPSQGSGTIPSTANTGGSVPNQFPTTFQTLQQIANLLASQGIATSQDILTNFGANLPGVTYQYAVTGATLRVEQLSVGAVPSSTGGGGLVLAPQQIATGLIGNDVRVSQLLNVALSGIFIQFEAPSSPVFLGKPGETYTLPFTKVFVTVFGTANRYRLIIGAANATVSGGRDISMMRQQLHLWDGIGIFDNPTNMPVPFSSQSDLGFGTTGAAAAFINFTTFFGGAGANTTLLANYDSGANTSVQPGNKLVGSVLNKGYRVIWLSNIQFQVKASTGKLQVNQAELVKAIIAPSGVITDIGQAKIVQTYLTGVINPDIDSAMGFMNFNIQFDTPKRIVLMGFDTYNAATGGVQATGESLMFYLRIISRDGADAGVQAFVNIEGYLLPQLLPYNPYAQDQFLSS